MDLKERAGDNGKRHPWERTRFAFFQELLRESDQLRASDEILDVGSGDAWFSGQLARHNQIEPITCWDMHYSDSSAHQLGIDERSVKLCRERPQRSFDLVLLLDVLEHVEDDVAFLRETVEKNLRPGGTVLVSVPAWKQLHSEHDRWLQHFRRYVPSEFRHALHSAGLQPIKKGGLFHSLLLPRALGVLKERALRSGPAADEPTLDWQAGPFTDRLVTGALRADNWVSRAASKLGLPLPGLSLWALCQQRQ